MRKQKRGRPRWNPQAFGSSRFTSHKPGRPIKVVVQRKQRIRLQLPENPAKFLFDSVDRMKEIAATHTQLARTESPIRAQKEMIAKQLMLYSAKISPGYQTKVRHIFLV